MILVIDNYDSFVYNLVQYFGEMGCEVVVVRNDKVTIEEVEQLSPEYLVISPGPCTPDEAGVSVDVIRAFAGRIPILGVCLGHQAIGRAFGARIVRAPRVLHGKSSEIFHDGRTIYKGIENPLIGGRYHSLVIDPTSIPDELEVSAHTSDGTIMGVRLKQGVVEGVQFHPESVLTPSGKRILKNFLELRA